MYFRIAFLLCVKMALEFVLRLDILPILIQDQDSIPFICMVQFFWVCRLLATGHLAEALFPTWIETV